MIKGFNKRPSGELFRENPQMHELVSYAKVRKVVDMCSLNVAFLEIIPREHAYMVAVAIQFVQCEYKRPSGVLLLTLKTAVLGGF